MKFTITKDRWRRQTRGAKISWNFETKNTVGCFLKQMSYQVNENAFYKSLGEKPADIVTEIIKVNDDISLDDSSKEEQLTNIVAKYGHEVLFV